VAQGRRSAKSRIPANRRRRKKRLGDAFESLEPRLVLSGTPSTLSADQVAALSQGVTILAQRLSEAQAVDLLASSAAGIGQPLGTLVSVGDELRAGLADPLAVSLSGGMSFADIASAFASAAAASATDFIDVANVTSSVATTSSGQTIVWFDIQIAGSETLVDYELDLGQAGIDGATGLLRDQGLVVEAVAVDLEATLSGSVQIGVNLSPGLSSADMICVKSDGLTVGASATATVADVATRFGAVRLGDAVGADISVALDIGAKVDLQESASGCLSLGSLAGGSLGDIVSQVDVSTAFDVTIPFSLDLGGFDLPVGSALELGIGAIDLLDAATIDMTLPTLAIGGVPFDFTGLGTLSANDFGAILVQLEQLLPQFTVGLPDLPLLGKGLGDLFDLGTINVGGFPGGIGDLIDSLKPGGGWSFDTIQDLIDQLVTGLGGGISLADFGLAWNTLAGSIEFTLPLELAGSATVSFDGASIVPALPIDIVGRGSASVAANVAIELTAGVVASAASSSVRVYFVEQAVATGNVTLEATLEAGASLGPLALSVLNGAASGSASLTLALVDPGAGVADDGRVYLDEFGGSGMIAAELVAPAIDGIFQLLPGVDGSATQAALLTQLEIVRADYTDAAEGSPVTVVPDTTLVPYLILDVDAGGAGGWGFSVAPSEKLQALLDGVGGFSLDDLPGMLSLLRGYLTDVGFWDVEIPLAGVSIGDVFGFIDAIDGFVLPDLVSLLGDPALAVPSGGVFSFDIAADFDLALDEDFSTHLPSGLFERLQRLTWDFSDLVVQWQGRDPTLPDFDVDFLSRLRGFGSELNLVFAAMPDLSGMGTFPKYEALRLQLDGLRLFIDGLGGGLESFGPLLEAAFPGIGLSIDTSLGTYDGADAVVLDLTYTLAISRSFDFSTIDIGGGIPLDVTGAGTLDFLLGGEVNARLGWNLATKTPFLDPAGTSIAATLAVDDHGGLEIGASLGGVVGISLGSSAEPDHTKASISLKNTAGDGPATLSVSAAGIVVAEAAFAASLPIYVYPAISGLVGTLDVEADLNLAAADPFSASVTYTGTAEYPDLASIISSLDFSLAVWFEGAAAFVGELRSSFDEGLLSQLPFASSVDVSSGGFLAQLQDVFATAANYTTPDALATELTTRLNTLLPDSLAASFSFEVDGVSINDGDTTDFADLLADATSELIVIFSLTAQSTDTIAAADFDFGLDSLGLGLRGTGGIDVQIDYQMNVGLGFSRTRGFFVSATEAADELHADVGLAFAPGSNLELSLGPLFFSLTDGTPGMVSDPAKRELHAAIDFNLDHAGPLSLAGGGVFDNATIDVELMARLALDLEAKLFGAALPGLGVSLDAGFYDASGGTPEPVTLSYTFGSGTPDFSGLSGENFHFGVTDIYLGLEGLIAPGSPIANMFEKFNAAIEPIRPVLDILTTEIPVVSDVSKLAGGPAITFVSLIDLEYPGTSDVINTINGIADFLSSFDAGPSGGLRMSLGSLAPTAAGTSSILAGAAISEDQFSHTAGTASGSDVTDPSAIPGSGGGDGPFKALEAAGLAFPLFASPGQHVFNLLFGKDVDIVTWDIPDLDNVGFSFEQSFPIFGPLFARVFGGVGFSTNFDLGFDTRGIRQALAGSTFNAGKIVNGVYFDDHVSGTTDLPEVSFTATIGAGAELNVVVAKAGVEGGLRGELGANLKDNNDDGKVHLDELLDNLSRGPECVFDFEGALKAFFEAYLKIGLDTPFGFITLFSDRFKLLEATIFEWNHVTCPPEIPVLGEVVSGFDHDHDAGTAGVTALVLNMGDRAGKVKSGNVDGDEEFFIDVKRKDDGSVADMNTIVIHAHDYEEEHSVAGFSWIAFDAGIGNDVVTISPQVSKMVYGFGGEGNDRLTGGTGPNTLHGGAGGDTLKGRSAGDTLRGDDDDDFLYGFGGDDTLVGGAGFDTLYGDDEVGDMADFNAANPDYLAGTPGDDVLDGGGDDDVLVGGNGSDYLDGGAGDDNLDGGNGPDILEGDEGNDRIHGGAGDDLIWGDDIAGVWSASGVDVNADNIEGGSGYNTIFGGPGYDIIYATTEADGVAGLSGATGTSGVPSISFVSGVFASFIDGGDGNDTIYGTAGRDYLAGGFEADYIETGDGGDFVNAGPGNDAVIVAAGDAEVYLGDGNDIVDGGPGNNWIEGGPGDDRIFAREGVDAVYGGSTARSYALRQLDLAVRAILDPLHGGFSATVAADSCAPTIHFHPEVYPDTPHVISGVIFEDINANGVRDTGEPDAPADLQWRLTVMTAEWQTLFAGDFWGGGFEMPESAAVPDGSYNLVVSQKPTGWFASTPTVQALAFPGSGPVELGFYRLGSIGGTVRQRDEQLQQDVPAGNTTVFLDADQDGEWDAGETATTTDSTGRYEFNLLAAGAYRVVAVPGAGCDVVTPRPASVLLAFGQSVTDVDFRITKPPTPVVRQVLLGMANGPWTGVPDGPAQIAPLDLADRVNHIAFDICSQSALRPSQGVASLALLDETGSDAMEWPLQFVGFDATGKRAIFAISSSKSPQALYDGWYEIRLSDDAIVDQNFKKLDGEWKNPTAADADGSLYASGNGVEGGSFTFVFQIGQPGMQALAAMMSGGGTVQGSVWWHDVADPLGVRSPVEQGLVGQTIRIVGATTGFELETVTGHVDLDGDGSLELDEVGGFRFTNLKPDVYTVSQIPAHPWEQVTPGGSFMAAELLAVTHDVRTQENKFWRINRDTWQPELLRTITGVFEARDIAATGGSVVYVTGTALDNGKATKGKGGLYAVDLQTGGITEHDPEPSGVVALSLDAVDDTSLVAHLANGKLAVYSLLTQAWSPAVLAKDATGTTWYPVGDIAVAGPGSIYAIVDAEQPANQGGAASQRLARIDLTAGVTNTTILGQLSSMTSRLIGLETVDQRLVALDTAGKAWTLEAPAVATLEGTVFALTSYQYGGLAALPASQSVDPSRKSFTVGIQGEETVDIGFGDEPIYELLPDGDDWIDGGCGADDDELHGDDVARDGSAPADLALDWWIITDGGNDKIRGRGGNDTIFGGQQGDMLYGDEGSDDITGGDSETNRLEGGDDDDTITGGMARDVALGQGGNDTIATLAGNDLLFGGDDDDALSGGDDDDTLVGGAGSDTVHGDAGNDTLIVIDVSLGAGFNDVPWVSGAADSYAGGTGDDLLVLNDDVSLSLSDVMISSYGVAHSIASIERAHLTGGVSANTIDASGFSGTTLIRGEDGNDTLTGGSGSDEIHGGAGNDVIAGGASDDDLWGEDDDDTIAGNDGTDTIRGGTGNNQLTGGGQSDTYIFVGAFNDRVFESAAGGGNDTLDLTAVTAGLIAVINDPAIGTRIFGASPPIAVDYLGNEIERILLGTGDDIVYVEDGQATTARIDAGTGEDTLSYAGFGGPAWSTPVSASLLAMTAKGVLGGIIDFENLTGGDRSDTLVGDAASNVIRGGDGHDSISGNSGDDQLWGDDGDDTLSGGADDDILAGGSGTNALTGGTGDDDYFFWAAGASDTVHENAGEGSDTIDFTAVSAGGIDATITASISVAYGTSTVTVPTAAGIDLVRGSSFSDHFRVADGTVFGGVLDGAATVTGDFTDMNILDLSAWTTPVAVSYVGALDASFVGTATGTGGIRNLRHVIGGTQDDDLRAGGMPVWFEGRAGDDALRGSLQDDMLDGGAGNDTLEGSWGDDQYVFSDVFGGDTIIENAFAGADTMDFSAVTTALEVFLGSVTVTDGTSTATHSGSHIERVLGGLADDDFVMTSSTVVFPGTLDGGAGTNTLWYDDPTEAIAQAVDVDGQTPNVSAALNFADVIAVLPLETTAAGPVVLGRDYSGDLYVNDATSQAAPVTYGGASATATALAGWEILEAETVGGTNNLYARHTASGRLSRLVADATWAFHGMSVASAAAIYLPPVLASRIPASPLQPELRIPVELNGAIALRRDTSGNLYADDGAAITPIMKDGSQMTQRTAAGYRPVAVESIATTRSMVLHDPREENVIVWSFDVAWSYLAELGPYAEGSGDADQAEDDFGLDIDLDGAIGTP
jgi:Ca2+-binding RTX toxin-like protein